MDPSMQAAPAPMADPAAEPTSGGGFTVELKVDAQGKMSVSVEPDAEEAGEEGGAPSMPGAPSSPVEAEGDDSQAVTSIGEALKLIREIVLHGGQMTDTTASVDEMSSGYGGDQ